ncbi:MAG: MFS transporter, partial [Bacillus sp. (in: Bacteria)]|nr:MFS transporter [Bacillus sp. (in: firmicutes)]
MYIMWFVNFFVSASITMIVPFLSLYIESLDSSYSNEFVQRWSGYVFGVTFLTAFLISPIWGRIGDRHGYKKILLINGIGIATSILLMGLVQTVYQLFALRLFMGLVTGFISTSMALISAQTEKATAGKTLGTMQMSNVAGGLFGPLMGGFMADSVGFIYTFFLTAAVIYVSAIVIIFGVKEQPIRSKEAKRVSYSRKDVLFHIFKQPLLVVTMLLTFITQVGNF